MFSTLPKPNFYFSVTFIKSSANAFNLDQSKSFLFGRELIWLDLCYPVLTFNGPKEEDFKTFREKEKNAVIKDRNHHFINIQLVAANAFNLR